MEANSNNQYLTEGASITRPPAFNGEDYHYWKERMKLFIESNNIDVWDVVTDGDYIPMEHGKLIPKAEWTMDQKARVQLNAKAKLYLICSLSKSEYEKVHGCSSAKEIWDTLAAAHEGTDVVKQTKISMLIHQYEMFKMEETETIDQMFGRFQTITNGLRSLGRSYDTGDNNRKILRSLPKSWRPKVTAIQEARDLNSLRMEELLGSLKVHELEMGEDEGKKKSLALKSKGKQIKHSNLKAMQAEEASEDDESESSSDEDNDLALLSRKIKKMLQNRGKFRRNQSSSSSRQSKDVKTDKIICFECKQPGHMKADCPKLKKESFKKKKKFFKKKKGLMATWEDLEDSSSEEEEEGSEEANLCLMADIKGSDLSEQEVPTETLSELYLDLMESSKELFHEYKILSKEHTEMCDKYKALEIENKRLMKKVFETESQSSQALSEENQKLQTQVEELTSDLASFVRGTKYLNMMLGNQQNTLDKSGLGYCDSDASDVSDVSKPAKKPMKGKRCSNCGKTGHNVTQCRHKRKVRTKANRQGPKKIWVPKNLIIPLADVLNRKKETPPMVPGQWVLTSHDGRKVFVPRTKT